jgi:hypothetical protein
MSKSKPTTLLQLAIAASAAVVPVLLLVLLVVASPSGGDSAKPQRGNDRHVSVRQVAALKTFEHGIVRRDRVQTPTPSADALLERVPQCRAEWSATKGMLGRVRAALTGSTDAGRSPAQRMAEQLVEIDRALLRFSSVENPRVADRVGLDGVRWLDAVVRTLATPVQAPDYPGQRFAVQCSDIRVAVGTLARSSARMLAVLAWRGTEVERVVAQWRADQYVEISPRHVARANPWAGIAGCIYLRHASDAPAYYVSSGRGLDERLCPRPEMVGAATSERASRIVGEPVPDMPVTDPRWRVPPSLGVMLQPLDAVHRPTGSLYRAFTESANDGAAAGRYALGPNRIEIDGNPVDVGFSIDVTIDPVMQALAQRTAACYTGRHDVCRALGIHRREDGTQPLGHALLEQAMVRMAAIAIVDVETGRIEALAGALSPCTRQEYDGPGRSRNCDRRLPYPIRYRPDALLNPAVFHDAMPASTIKPIMAAAFLSDPNVGARWLADEQAAIARSPSAAPATQSLRGQLMRSDSARFLDRMFCADKGFAPCDRPWAIQASAAAFGWNAGCTSPRDDCGKRDLLFGRDVYDGGDAGASGLALEVPFGRLMAEPLGGDLTAPFRLRPTIALDIDKIKRCAAGPDGKWQSRDDWEKCSGGVVVDVVAEGWGQGHARASALGGAGMMLTLAAAANGADTTRSPHLVEAIRGAGTVGTPERNAALMGFGANDGRPIRIAREAAEVILSGLTFGPRAGTSRRACEQIFEPKSCAEMDWIAGKTGTPTFPNDDRSLDELARLCATNVHKTKQERAACGPLRPYKWYVAAYRTDRDDPRWTKVIGVLTERNWLAANGRVHGAGDHGPNPAAEIAIQIAARQAGLLPWGER